MSRVRVVIVDDHKPFRRGLRRLLETEPGIQVVGEGESFGDAMRLVFELQPHVAIVDLSLPTPRNFRRTDFASLSHKSACSVIAMSIWVDEEADDLAKSLGASARVDKVCAHDALIPAIFDIMESRAHLLPQADAAVS